MCYILSDNEDVKFEKWFSNPSNVRQMSRTHILHNYIFNLIEIDLYGFIIVQNIICNDRYI